MTYSLLSPGREVLCLQSHTQEWVDATIVGPSARGADCIALKYMRGGHDFENPAAPLFAVEFPEMVAATTKPPCFSHEAHADP